MDIKPRRAWIDVRTLRQDKGWLQDETADKLGISRSYLSALENNKRSISVAVMDSIVQVFGVEYGDFFKFPKMYY